MKLLREILFVLFLFGSSCSILLVNKEFKISELFAAVKDSFASFDNISIIGLVVIDTSSLDVTYEQPIFDALNNAGMTVVKIDTTTMDEATYDASALNWSSLKVVIIPFGTDSATIDTSIANGINDVPLIILEPAYWRIFDLPDSTGTTASQDSFRLNGVVGFIDTSVIWSADDSIAFYSSNRAYYVMGPPTHDVNALLLTLDAADTVAVFDTLNGQPRFAFGLPDASKWSNNGKRRSHSSAWTMVNRAISRLTGTWSDSLYKIGISSTGEDLVAGATVQLKNHLELNGHQVIVCDDDSIKNGVKPHQDFNWTDLNGFIYWSGILNSADNDSVQDNINSVIIASAADLNTIANDYGFASSGSAQSQDSVRIISNTVNITSVFTTVPDTIKLFSSNVSVYQLTSPTNSVTLAELIDPSSTFPIWLSHKNKRHVYQGIANFDNAGSIADTTYWRIFNRSLGWIFEALPIQPSGFTLTVINTDSVGAVWVDNSSSENGYSIFIYEPDSAYFSHLGASVTTDTLLPFWPPNSRIIADVAVISGTDTVFSSGGKDTVYTLAVVPPQTFVINLSDTSMAFDVNGELLYEDFDDLNFSASPVWTVKNGSAEVDSSLHLRSTHVSDTTRISTPFISSTGDSINDTSWFVSFKFSDSTAVTSQFFRLYFMATKSDLDDSSGYSVAITASSGAVTLNRRSVNGVLTAIGTKTAVLDSNNIYKWHTLEIQRDWDQSPKDTTVTFRVLVDGDSLFSATDSTYFTSLFVGLEFSSGHTNIKADEIRIRQFRPSANHDSTQYAVQDSVNSKYVHDSPDTLRTSEDWRTYFEWGGITARKTTTKDTLTALPADSAFVLRSKSRNGWPSGN